MTSTSDFQMLCLSMMGEIVINILRVANHTSPLSGAHYCTVPFVQTLTSKLSCRYRTSCKNGFNTLVLLHLMTQKTALFSVDVTSHGWDSACTYTDLPINHVLRRTNLTQTCHCLLCTPFRNPNVLLRTTAGVSFKTTLVKQTVVHLSVV